MTYYSATLAAVARYGEGENGLFGAEGQSIGATRHKRGQMLHRSILFLEGIGLVDPQAKTVDNCGALTLLFWQWHCH